MRGAEESWCCLEWCCSPVPPSTLRVLNAKRGQSLPAWLPGRALGGKSRRPAGPCVTPAALAGKGRAFPLVTGAGREGRAPGRVCGAQSSLLSGGSGSHWHALLCQCQLSEQPWRRGCGLACFGLSQGRNTVWPCSFLSGLCPLFPLLSDPVNLTVNKKNYLGT